MTMLALAWHTQTGGMDADAFFQTFTLDSNHQVAVVCHAHRVWFFIRAGKDPRDNMTYSLFYDQTPR
jgi:hypothetical protein